MHDEQLSKVLKVSTTSDQLLSTKLTFLLRSSTSIQEARLTGICNQHLVPARRHVRVNGWTRPQYCGSIPVQSIPDHSIPPFHSTESRHPLVLASGSYLNLMRTALCILSQLLGGDLKLLTSTIDLKQVKTTLLFLQWHVVTVASQATGPLPTFNVPC